MAILKKLKFEITPFQGDLHLNVIILILYGKSEVSKNGNVASKEILMNTTEI